VIPPLNNSLLGKRKKDKFTIKKGMLREKAGLKQAGTLLYIAQLILIEKE
jgi:hypothetical protein